ncbi:MAG TPA: MgtC/SapB family protein [Rhodocyclaceae bacterium]|jgi:putative Mg2+ transporter-C (MgtC) family protein|nr:MgtC/SapB family protein [Rhodocyclaceae bacterium]
MIGDAELISRLALAALLGGVIGFERERLSWAAGLRTHMLVCVGSALIMIVSTFGFADILGTPNVVLDPSRIAAQVVSGIGFLGAGSILLRGEIIRGLTTAASLWSVAAVGLAAGSGLYVAATAATVIILIILAGLKPIERRYFAVRQRRELSLVVRRGAMTLHALESALGPGSSRVKKFVVQQADSAPDTDEVLIEFSKVSDREFEAIRCRLVAIDGVLSAGGNGE